MVTLIEASFHESQGWFHALPSLSALKASPAGPLWEPPSEALCLEHRRGRWAIYGIPEMPEQRHFHDGAKDRS